MTEKRKVILRDGTPGIVRPISPADRDAFVIAFEALSEESRFRRFFYRKSSLADAELEVLANPDGINHIAYGVAALEEDQTEIPISVGHCFRQKDEADLAEIAVVTSDLWQGNGAGSELIQSLAAASLETGIRRWLAVMLSDNYAMQRLLEKYGTLENQSSSAGGVIEAVYKITDPSV